MTRVVRVAAAQAHANTAKEEALARQVALVVPFFERAPAGVFFFAPGDLGYPGRH